MLYIIMQEIIRIGIDIGLLPMFHRLSFKRLLNNVNCLTVNVWITFLEIRTNVMVFHGS